MAAGSTTYNFEIALSDISRNVYESLTLRVARHSSELMDCTVCKALAYCIEYNEHLEFTKGLDDPEVPAIWAKDLTGRITSWIEIGSPSAEKLHKASKNVGHVSIFTYKTPGAVLQQLSGSKIHQAEQIMLHSFTNGFLSDVAAVTDKRNVWSLTISEGTVYLDVAQQSFTALIHSRTIAQ